MMTKLASGKVMFICAGGSDYTYAAYASSTQGAGDFAYILPYCQHLCRSSGILTSGGGCCLCRKATVICGICRP
jgi:hypothetical protein